jgi:hypothetical protein
MYGQKSRRQTSYLGIHHIRCDIYIRDVLAKSAPQIRLDLLEIQGSHANSWTSIDPWFVPDNLAPERLREATNGLSQIALEELNDRQREVKLICTLEDLGL